MKLRILQLPKIKISLKQRLIFSAITSAFLIGATIGLIIYFNSIPQQSKAAMGMHGAKTITAMNSIVNEYTSLTANASIGATTLSVVNSGLNGNSRFPTTLQAGELIMIIQMHGANISNSNNANWGNIASYGNAGNYEFKEVLDVPNATTITVSSALLKSYTSTDNVQIVRVPRYTSLLVQAGASITAPAWNGTSGGIVTMEVNGASTIKGTIDVSGLGFRGGATDNSATLPGVNTWASPNALAGAEKGESISGYQGDYNGVGGSYGRGAPANGGGGGNAYNAGGGGGANANPGGTWSGRGNPDNSTASNITAWNIETAGFAYTTSPGGGRGGYSFSNVNNNPTLVAHGNVLWSGDNRSNRGGYGGRPLDYTTGRLFFGGGGGAGDGNSNAAGAGGNGGGLVFLISAGAVNSTGSILANGNNGSNSTNTSSSISGNDGAGGGGGGGAIVIYTKATISGVSFSAIGGNGGSQNINTTLWPTEADGPGGGGGGGYITLSNNSGLTENISGGVNGTTNSAIMTLFLPNGATKGGSGQIVVPAPIPVYPSASVLPITLSLFTATLNNTGTEVGVYWVTAAEINNEFFTVQRSENGIEYTQLTEMPGAGTSIFQHTYTYTDMNPLPGVSYYRLKQTDVGGEYQYGAIQSVNNEFVQPDNTINLYPTPANQYVYVDLNMFSASSSQIMVVDLTGKVVKTISNDLNAGKNKIKLDISELPNGIYFVNMQDETGKMISQKMIKAQ